MFRVYTDDEKPPPLSSSVNTASGPAAPAKPAPHTIFLDRFQELNTYRWCFSSFGKCSDSDNVWIALFLNCDFFFLVCSSSNEVVSHLKDYLFNELPLDIENVHKGSATLQNLRCTLGTACQGLHRSGFSCFYYQQWAERGPWMELKCSEHVLLFTKMYFCFIKMLCIDAVRSTWHCQAWKHWPRSLTTRAAL